MSKLPTTTAPKWSGQAKWLLRDIHWQDSAYRPVLRGHYGGGMNRMHRWLCSWERWAKLVASEYLPWALTEVELGDDVLEIGPGYGATTRALQRRAKKLT